MASITRWVVGISGMAASVLGLAAYGRAHWAEATKRLLVLLEATRLPPTVTHYDVKEIEGLPAPVQRYFCAVLKEGQRVRTARRSQSRTQDVGARRALHVLRGSVEPQTEALGSGLLVH